MKMNASATYFGAEALFFCKKISKKAKKIKKIVFRGLTNG